MQHFAQQAPAPVPEKSVREIEKALIDRVRPAIQDTWPSLDVPIQDFDAILRDTGITVNVRYQGTKELDNVAVNMVLRAYEPSSEYWISPWKRREFAHRERMRRQSDADSSRGIRQYARPSRPQD